ncbi:MAG: hypothetical protein QM726_12920 [Chitinophagaceae bacterium]
MTWITSEIEYEDLPLLLRKPEYQNIWDYKDKFTRLVSIEHHLKKVTNNGLPEKEYNLTLAGFDHYMCSIFNNSSDGLIFLIETFSGKRNYYYFTLPDFKMQFLIERAIKRFDVVLESWTQMDIGWGFLNAYPVKLH